MLSEEFSRDRSEVIASYMIEHQVTVRRAAQIFHISKSTVHKDVTGRLREVDPPLYAQVQQVLAVNKAQRHIRGGQATREKYRRGR
ncbi:MAG: sporulation transcriptional regulator SpoIIID [Eubacteriales bacterium]